MKLSIGNRRYNKGQQQNAEKKKQKKKTEKKKNAGQCVFSRKVGRE